MMSTTRWNLVGLTSMNCLNYPSWRCVIEAYVSVSEASTARRSAVGYAEARRLVVVLLAAPSGAPIAELRARRQLLQMAIRIAAATLVPRRRLMAPRQEGRRIAFERP